ncbi:MAG: tetratricopeptide repeat protein [Reichenbachiella sp.]
MKNIFLAALMCALFTYCSTPDTSSLRNQYDKAYTHFENGNYTGSLALLIEVIANSKKSSSHNLIGDSHYLIAYNFKKLYHPDSALKSLYEARDSYILADNETQEAVITNEIGILLMESRAFLLAEEYYEEALKLAEDRDNKYLISNGKYNLGLCLRKMGDYLEAYYNYHQSLGIELDMDIPMGDYWTSIDLIELSIERPSYVADILLEQGICKFKQGNLHAASGLFWQVVKIAEKYALSKKMGQAYNRNGDCKLALGEVDSSKIYYLYALDLFANEPKEQTQVYSNLGKAHLISGEYTAAIDYYELAIHGDITSTDLDDAKVACDSLKEFFKNKNDLTNALLISEKRISFDDIAQDIKRRVKKANKSQYAISAMYMQLDRKIRLEKQASINNLIYASGILFIILTLASIWYNRKKKSSFSYSTNTSTWKINEVKEKIKKDKSKI